MTAKINPNGLNININLSPERVFEMLQDMAYYDDLDVTIDNVEDFINYVSDDDIWGGIEEAIMEVLAGAAQDFTRMELPRLLREKYYDSQ